jgi:hypothetical protein
MWAIIQTILSFIPGFTNILESWFKAKADVELAKVKANEAVGSEAVKAAAQEADGRAKTWGVIGASSLLTWLVIILAMPIAVFEWKVVIWDTVLQWGTTDPIKGQVADWMNTIIASLFASSTVLATAQLWWTTKP